MAYGLQVFGNKGNLLVDISDRFTRLHSQITFNITTRTTGNRFVPVTGMVNDGTWLIHYPNVCNIINVVIGTGGFTVYWDALYGKSESLLLNILRI
jgi:hypothetical protein